MKAKKPLSRRTIRRLKELAIEALEWQSGNLAYTGGLDDDFETQRRFLQIEREIRRIRKL